MAEKIRVVNALEQIQLDMPGVVTVGMFDGVHQGHARLIREVTGRARELGGQAVVVSFYPHPDVLLRGITGRYYLTTPDEKARLMQAMGVDVLVLQPFDESLRQMRAAAFVDRLVKHLNMRALLATPDFAMGYQREGDIAFLTDQGKRKNFTVSTVELVGNDGKKISSSEIRGFLGTGELDRANALLGRRYRLSGEVVDGDKRGQTIGFPTANLGIWEEQIIPANGVYACRALLNEEAFDAVTNIGNRPTFGGQQVRVEAHLMNFDRSIYGQTLTLEFVEFLRAEVKFKGIDELVSQIGADRDRASEILAGTTA